MTSNRAQHTRANLHVFDHHVANTERLLPEAHFQQLHLTHTHTWVRDGGRMQSPCAIVVYTEQRRRHHLLQLIFNVERGLLQKPPREKGAVLGRKDVCVRTHCYDMRTCDACGATQMRKLNCLSFQKWRSMNAAAAAAATQQKR